MAQLNWQDLSEIVYGRVLTGLGGITADMIKAGDICDPYPAGLEAIKKEKKTDRMIDVSITTIGLPAVEAALSATERTARIPANWAQLLSKSAEQYRGGAKLSKFGKDMSEGREIDLADVLSVIQKLDSDIGQLTSLADIKPETQSFMPTGYSPLDVFLGGIPKAGLTVIGASPGSGKSTLMVRLAAQKARQLVRAKLPGTIAIFSLEMTMAQIAKRALDIEPGLSKEEKSRVLISDEILSPQAISSVAARAKSNGAIMIGVDFAELTVQGEFAESTVGAVYVTLANTAKRLGIPVILLSQLSRQYVYNSGIPKLTDLRYSGLAEAMAALVLLLYNPSMTYIGQSGSMQQNGRPSQTPALEAVPGKAYIIAAKSRFGFKRGGTGAIQVDWDGEAGFGSTGHWFSLGAADLRE